MRIAILLAGLSCMAAGCGKCSDGSCSTASDYSTVSSSESSSNCCEVPTAVTAPTEEETPAVELKFIKLNQLLSAIKEQKGKIVVVDFWATFCVPCKKEFPRLVKLHEQHARDGLVCMSVCVDEKDERQAAADFLTARKAAFANYLIDEPAAAWQNHFVLKGVPAVFIWDRTGKQAARFDGDDPDNQFTYTDVEKKVAELLKTK